MHQLRTFLRWFLLCSALGWVVANQAGAAEKPEAVTAFVAASTQDALQDAAAAFTKQTGIAIKISPGASNALANQLLNGAEADLFLSASQEWATKVGDEGLADTSRPLLTNDLVLVVPKGNPAGVKKLDDLLGKRVEHVALAGEKVPAGVYAQQALKAAGLYDQLLAGKKIVRGQDVRGTLTFVERGEAEAGVVYATDARVSDKVEIALTFDPRSHEKIVYPLVLLKHGAARPAAKQFFEFLSSEPAEKIFVERGFRLLKP